MCSYFIPYKLTLDFLAWILICLYLKIPVNFRRNLLAWVVINFSLKIPVNFRRSLLTWVVINFALKIPVNFRRSLLTWVVINFSLKIPVNFRRNLLAWVVINFSLKIAPVNFRRSLLTWVVINFSLKIPVNLKVNFLAISELWSTCTRIIKIILLTFFVWALLLIVHTWNSNPLRSNLPGLQYTCTVPTTSGRPIDVLLYEPVNDLCHSLFYLLNRLITTASELRE